MENQIFNAFLEFGAMGLFCGFLVWQHLNMQKRLDQLVERFQAQLENIQEKTEANEDKLRSRYDLILDEYRSEKTAVRLDISGQLTKVMNKLESLPFDNMMIQIEALSLNQRNSHRILEKIREEQKIKAMARNMSVERET
tara:strand:- start:67 stop:486 length:420 start_codon:yes stop_codon:yes gene_type:complete